MLGAGGVLCSALGVERRPAGRADTERTRGRGEVKRRSSARFCSAPFRERRLSPGTRRLPPGAAQPHRLSSDLAAARPRASPVPPPRAHRPPRPSPSSSPPTPARPALAHPPATHAPQPPYCAALFLASPHTCRQCCSLPPLDRPGPSRMLHRDPGHNDVISIWPCPSYPVLRPVGQSASSTDRPMMHVGLCPARRVCAGAAAGAGRLRPPRALNRSRANGRP